MKKVTVAILAVIYLAVSSGVVMTLHYCMGKIASVDVMHKSDKCGKCGMNFTDGCCKDEFKIVKLSDSHQLISNDIKIPAAVAVSDDAHIFFYHQLFSSRYISNHKNHSSPPYRGVSLNILYRVFRI